MAARAKKKITTTTEELDDDGVESNDTEKLDDETIRALAEMEGASEIRWQVHRLGGTNPGFCPPAMTTPELTLENIARRHGPGNYRVRGVKSDGQYFKSATITIAESATPAMPDFSTLLKDLNKGDQGMMPLLMGMMQSNTQIVTAALARQPERAEIPWSAIITASPLMLTALKEFFAKKDESNDAMERLLKQLTIVEKLRGDDKKEGSSWPDIIRDALPSLSSLVARAPAAGAAGQQQSIRVPVVSSTPAGVLDQAGIDTPEAVAPTTEVMTMDFFKRKFEELLRNAAQNKDPELRAALFVDDLPNYIPDAVVREMLSAEDWFARLCAFDARVANYEGWFTELREHVLQALSEEPAAPGHNDEEPT